MARWERKLVCILHFVVLNSCFIQFIGLDDAYCIASGLLAHTTSGLILIRDLIYVLPNLPLEFSKQPPSITKQQRLHNPIQKGKLKNGHN